jgi:DMSO reductase family type II enzyme chaperone
MKAETLAAATPANLERSVQDRDADLTAAVRCRVYGLYSALIASPHEIDGERQLQDCGEIVDEQPYGIDLRAITSAYLDYSRAQRKLEYSRLFEVGDKAPPVPIREQQQFNHLAGIREDLVRYYDFFEYALHQRYAWAPDHISVLLEFCRLLCYLESIASEDRLSHQLAQLDFVSRHLVHWTPIFADRISTVSPTSIYAMVARSLSEFVTKDYEWQVSTVVVTDMSCDRG